MRILDFLQQPASTDVDAFIVRLAGEGWSADTERDNLRTYVVTPKVQAGLDQLLTSVGQRFAENQPIGRYIYGNFGSGKSHLMTVLGRMLEGSELPYDLGDPALRVLRQSHPWMDRRKTLVVRLNMMGRDTLRAALYDAYSHTIERLGHTAPNLSDHEEIFTRFERDGERFPGGFDAWLAHAVADEPRLTLWSMHRDAGNLAEKLELAALVKGWRDHGSADHLAGDDVRVAFRDGMARIAQHAKELGYDGITWLIDELVIWLRGKLSQDYSSQINDLSAMIDSDMPRVLPFFVAVAVQTSITETCPQDLSEAAFRVRLGHIANRFQPMLQLEEQDLYKVAEKRVLDRRKDLPPGQIQAFEDGIDRFLDQKWPEVEKLSGGLDRGAVRAVYPFHPALLRILVDATQALSRSRTAIGALFRLIRAYDDLKVGQFIPVGALWDVLFDADGASQARQGGSGALAQRIVASIDTWERLQGKTAVAAGESDNDKKGLSQVVRTALLAQLSDRSYYPNGQTLRDQLTARALWLLNQRDVPGLNEVTAANKVAAMLRRLASSAAEVVVGSDANPAVRIETHRVDYQAVLERAKADLSTANRFAAIRALVDSELGLGLGTAANAPLKVTWRGTDRSGRIRFGNVRTLGYAGSTNEFAPAPAEAFLLLIDYPYDEDATCTRQDDAEHAARARSRNTQWTLIWLPDHFDAPGMEALSNYAAIELISRDERNYLDQHAPAEAQQIKAALHSYREQQRQTLVTAIRNAYFDKGQIRSMRTELDVYEQDGAQRLDPATAAKKLAECILDGRYPNHPLFTRKINRNDFTTVADLVVRAIKTGAAQTISGVHANLVSEFGLPLELAYGGAGSVAGREDGKYLGALKRHTEGKQKVQARELRDLMGPDGDWKWGLGKETCDLLLFVLVFARNYEVRVGGQAKTVQGVGDLPEQCEFVLEDVVDNATWDKAIAAAEQVLGLVRRNVVVSAAEQGKLSKDIKEASSKLGGVELNDYIARLELLLGKRTLSHSKRKAQAVSLRTATDAAVLARLDGHNAGSTADRVRVVAAWRDHGDAAAWRTLRQNLADERRALEQISDKLDKVHYIERLGDAEERRQTALRLDNWLGDGVEIPLKAQIAAWAADVDRIFGQMILCPPPPPPPRQPPPRDPPVDDPPPKDPPPPPPPEPPKGKHVKRQGIGRHQLQTEAQAAVAELLALQPAGQKFKLVIELEDE